jgi:prepilin peptidase CpaA
MTTSSIALLTFGITAACLLLFIASSLHDLAARTIPDAFSIAIALLGATARILQNEIASGLIVALLLFGAAVFCWRRGWMGGGDVKLLGAAALALPPASVLLFVAVVALAGGVLAMMYLTARLVVPAPAALRPSGLLARAARVECWRIRRRGPLPYACAISAGFAFVVS